MKLIRLTDDRYLFDAGQIDQRTLEEIRHYWDAWWEEHHTHPTVMVIGGIEQPIEYEDRREPDIESRLRALEEAVFGRQDPPVGGIEQYQAEGR